MLLSSPFELQWRSHRRIPIFIPLQGSNIAEISVSVGAIAADRIGLVVQEVSMVFLVEQ